MDGAGSGGCRWTVLVVEGAGLRIESRPFQMLLIKNITIGGNV